MIIQKQCELPGPQFHSYREDGGLRHRAGVGGGGGKKRRKVQTHKTLRGQNKGTKKESRSKGSFAQGKWLCLDSGILKLGKAEETLAVLPGGRSARRPRNADH